MYLGTPEPRPPPHLCNAAASLLPLNLLFPQQVCGAVVETAWPGSEEEQLQTPSTAAESGCCSTGSASGIVMLHLLI